MLDSMVCRGSGDRKEVNPHEILASHSIAGVRIGLTADKGPGLKIKRPNQEGRERDMKMTEKIEVAYYLLPGSRKGEGQIVCIKAGEQGYHPVNDYDDMEPSDLPGIVDRLNKRNGVSKKRADQIVAKSMTGV